MRTGSCFGAVLAVSAAVLVGVAQSGSAWAQDLKCEPDKVAEKYPSLADEVIRIGADPQSPPYVFRDSEDFNKVVGFDADLARAVFDCAGVETEFFLGGWSGLLPAVMAGQIDVMWNALYYKPERAEKVDFIIYMQAGTGALIKKGNPKNINGLEDICGLNASTLLGTVEEAALRDQDNKCKAAGKPGVNIMTAPDSAAANRLLQNDRVELQLTDLGLAGRMAKDQPDQEAGFKILSGFKMGAAVQNDREDLINAIYDGLRIMQANGTQVSIFKKYDMDPDLLLPTEVLRE